MKTRTRIAFARTIHLCLAVYVTGAPRLHAQQQRGNPPRIGYVYPAGLQSGTSCEMLIGGQYLEGTTSLLISGSGVKATVLKYHKPLPQKRINELREYLLEARKKFVETGVGPAALKRPNGIEAVTTILKEAGATDDEIKSFFEARAQRSDPKRQQNMQIAENITIKMEVAADTQPGPRELRMLTPAGASNPLSFCIGKLPEQCKSGPLGKTIQTAMQVTIPTVLNGQILPGEVDHYAFKAKKNQHLVIAVQARDLIPFLADAVPGWFQPVIALHDAKGREVAYADDYRFSPDPVLRYDVPEDGAYLLEIKDSLYRGREDFVYRITVGEIPFITGIYPLGGRTGPQATVTVTGWNLTRTQAVLNTGTTDGLRRIPDVSNGLVIGDVTFACDSLPETAELEPNNELQQAQRVTLPATINGRISAQSDIDVFAISCSAGAKIVTEVNARKLASPLDSYLKITDANGRQLALNDDWDDKGIAMLTHKADSYIAFTATTAGVYYVHLGDTQQKGGPEYAYRLRISAPRPDYALRIVPSSINSRPGASVPVTLYALRKDGYEGDITLALNNAPAGFVLNGGCIPAGEDKVRATITFPQDLPEGAQSLAVKGSANVDGRDITHMAVPADDMIQAFMYHHLVPTRELLAIESVGGPGGRGGRGRPPISFTSQEPVKLPAGGSGHVSFMLPRRAQGVMNDVVAKLNDPPEGISVEGISMTDEGVSITFRTDAAKVKTGQRGNLIVELFFERTPPAADGKKTEKRSFSVGFLPAIPFKVIAH